MKNVFKFLSFILIFSTLQSCITIQSVSISDVRPANGNVVKGSASGIGFLHLGVPGGLAESAAEELRSKGAVSNISTTFIMREWGIFQYYKVSARGISENK